MKKIMILLFSCLFVNANAQEDPSTKEEEKQSVEDCVFLRVTGDVYLRSLSPQTNYGSHPDFSAHAWTNSSEEVIVRGLINFDFSEIPEDAIISSAHLSLYSYESPGNGMHSKLSGSNAALIKRVIEPWDEMEVSWATQPLSTTENQLELEETLASEIQDYIDIDLTALVQDAIDNPDDSHGFLFRLINETYYRKMLFASSNNSNQNLHPELEVCYNTDATVGLNEEEGSEEAFTAYPNPMANDLLYITLPQYEKDYRLRLLDHTGRLVEERLIRTSIIEWSFASYEKGIYILQLSEVNGALKPIHRKIIY